MGTLLKVWGWEGWRGFVAGWRKEGSLSLSLSLCLPTYLAALKGVMEAVRGYIIIIIIIIITGSGNHGFSSSTDGRTLHDSQKAFFFPSKQFPDLEKRFSSRVCQVIGRGRGEGNRLISLE